MFSAVSPPSEIADSTTIVETSLISMRSARGLVTTAFTGVELAADSPKGWAVSTMGKAVPAGTLIEKLLFPLSSVELKTLPVRSVTSRRLFMIGPCWSLMLPMIRASIAAALLFVAPSSQPVVNPAMSRNPTHTGANGPSNVFSNRGEIFMANTFIGYGE